MGVRGTAHGGQVVLSCLRQQVENMRKKADKQPYCCPPQLLLPLNLETGFLIGTWLTQ